MAFAIRYLQACIFLVTAAKLNAQWPNYPARNAPRTPDGKIRMDAPTPKTPEGNPDLSGIWEVVYPERGAMNNQFWDIAIEQNEALPFQPWAEASLKKRMAAGDIDNPDANCLPLGPMQLQNHPQPRKIIQTRDVILIMYEANSGLNRFSWMAVRYRATIRNRGGMGIRLDDGMAIR